MVIKMTDQKIIELFFARSQEAVDAVEDKYGQSLLALSKNILGNYSDAEECVNDTLLAVWNAIPPKRPSPLFPWLCAVSRNISMNRYRMNTAGKRGGGRSCEAFDELEDVFPAADTPESELSRRELARTVDRFLSRLSIRDRKLFLGRYFAGKSISELAEYLGLTESNCRVRLARLRKKLREHLEREGAI